MIQHILNSSRAYIFLGRINNLQIICSASIHKCSHIVFEKSIVYWTLQHFKSNKEYETHVVNSSMNLTDLEIKSKLMNSHTLSLIDTNDLLTLMIIGSRNFIKDRSIIINVDKELCKRLYDENDCKNILRITDTLLHFTHNRVSMVKSYKMCIEFIMNILKHKEITLQQFIQCAFYTSVLKDDPVTRITMNIILRKIYMQTLILNSISPTELGIFCNSIYKTSTKIKSKKILNALIEVTNKEANNIFTTPLLSISIMKPLHQAKYQDYCFLKRLSNDILKKNNMVIEKYDFMNIVYLLKLFTNALYNDESIINYLSDLAVIKLNNLYDNKEYIRAKDISTLLKSFCELGSDSLRQKTNNNILPIINDAIKNRSFQKNELICLTEILLWISILDSSMLDKSILNSLINTQLITLGKNSVKGIARMNLLLRILSIERKIPINIEEQLMQLIEPTDEYDFTLLSTRRPKLYEIYQATHCLSTVSNKGIRNVKIECQIPNLYLPGIIINTESCNKIAIESLDEKVCLHDSLIPNGYMKLKLRLLKKSGYKVITIPHNIVGEGSESLFTTIDENITKMEAEQ